jgi:hypothetical protein
MKPQERTPPITGGSWPEPPALDGTAAHSPCRLPFSPYPGLARGLPLSESCMRSASS